MEKTKDHLIQPEVLVKQSPIHRYGVFANIEECPAIIFPRAAKQKAKEIYDREFIWDDKNNAIFLGNGSIYNHAQSPNAIFKLNEDSETVSFIANCSINKGEEIFISYGKDWFAIRGAKEMAMVPPEKQDMRIFLKVFGLIVILLILSKVFPV